MIRFVGKEEPADEHAEANTDRNEAQHPDRVSNELKADAGSDTHPDKHEGGHQELLSALPQPELVLVPR